MIEEDLSSNLPHTDYGECVVRKSSRGEFTRLRRAFDLDSPPHIIHMRTKLGGVLALIPQQDVVIVQGRDTVQQLKDRLEAYPPVRIVSIASHVELGAPTLIAVIETI